MSQAVQLSGAACILVSFVLNQMGKMPTNARGYLWLNLFGGLFLGGTAFASRQWGFVVLESVWTVVSVVGLIRAQLRVASDSV